MRELWRYPDHYPHDRLLTPDDFVTWRVNWTDKADQHRLHRRGAGLRARRLRVHRRPSGGARARPPGPAAGGGAGARTCSALRRILLDRPAPAGAEDHRRVGGAHGPGEGPARCATASAPVTPERGRFLASLEVVCAFERPSGGGSARAGRSSCSSAPRSSTPRAALFPVGELARHAEARRGLHRPCSRSVRRLWPGGGGGGEGGEIIAFAMSCRVIGLERRAQFIGLHR